MKIWAEAHLPVWSYCSQRSPTARAEAWDRQEKSVQFSGHSKTKNHKTKERVKAQLGKIFNSVSANTPPRTGTQHSGLTSPGYCHADQEVRYSERILVKG